MSYNYSLWNIWVASTLLKILLFPTYHSTDFDVHRNWLSITNLLPLKDWYIENTNQWTLDYPPFFAYFEWFLSKFVPNSIAIDDGCLNLVPIGNYGFKTVIFQRSTVILSEILLFISLQWFINTSTTIREKKRNFVISASIVLSPGLFIIDHIHFQYNGFLFGILILSIVNAKLNNYLACGFWFSVLLCFKHIFLYIAPAYFIYLLSAYCLNPIPTKFNYSIKSFINLINWKNLIKLSLTVLSVFFIAFAPFIYFGVLPQLINRLFPFSRGLTHAYWAPNIWAIYSFIDRLLILVFKKFPFLFKFFNKSLKFNNLNNSLTRGLVGDVKFTFLPNIKPNYTFLLTLFYQIMSLIPLFIQPKFERFIGSMTLCAFSSFLFGWHVHEKAIMLIIIPLTFVICQDRRLLPPFQLLTSAGYVSLFPLLFGSAEWMLKSLITFVWFIVFQTSFSEVVHFQRKLNTRVIVLDRLNLIYMLLFIPICIILQLLDIESRNFKILKKLEFLRLMMYSVYCSIGIILSWSSISWLYFLDDPIWTEKNDDEYLKSKKTANTTIMMLNNDKSSSI